MRKNYVVGFAFSADRSKIVLIHKNRPAWQAGKWNGPGGKFNEGETGEACMCREFEEETGVKTVPADWHYYTKIIGQDGDVLFFRMFDDKALQATKKTDEEVLIVDVDYNLLAKNGLSNLVWLISIALDENQPEFFVEANYNQDFTTGKNAQSTPRP